MNDERAWTAGDSHLGKMLLDALREHQVPGRSVRLENLPIILEYDAKEGWKVSEKPQDQKDMDKWRAGMMKPDSIKFGYDKLRRIVIALFESGMRLKDDGLTFSHGNIGNEYIDFAHKIDRIVDQLEPHHEIVIMPQHVLDKHLDNFREECKTWRKSAEELQKKVSDYIGFRGSLIQALKLDCGKGITDQEIVNQVYQLLKDKEASRDRKNKTRR